MSRVVAQGDQRPMAEDRSHAMNDLKAILSSRGPLYAQADLVLETSGSILQESLACLVTVLEESAAGPPPDLQATMLPH